MSFSSLAQFGAFGLRREVLLPRKRAVTLVDTTTDRLAVAAHDWGGDEYLQIEVVPGSATSPVLPGGLSASAVYRPLPVSGSDSLFGLSLTEGGPAVDITDAGAGSFAMVEQMSATIQRYLDAAQSQIVEALIDYKAPIENPPIVLVQVECWIAAYEMGVSQGVVVPTYWDQSRQTIEALYQRAQRYLELWAAGKPIQGLGADATPGESENGTFVAEGPLAPSWFASCNGKAAVP